MKLIGYVDGVEISFDFYPPNIFRGIIPKRLNGKYVVELKAIDDAGNVNGTTDILVYIDFQKMEFKILKDNFKFDLDNQNLKYMEINEIYYPKILERNFSFKKTQSKYSYRELVII